jgi:hypothetical protein
MMLDPMNRPSVELACLLAIHARDLQQCLKVGDLCSNRVASGGKWGTVVTTEGNPEVFG